MSEDDASPQEIADKMVAMGWNVQLDYRRKEDGVMFIAIVGENYSAATVSWDTWKAICQQLDRAREKHLQ